MKFAVLGSALIWGLLTGVALAEQAQCSVTDFGTFDCELSRDGGGLTFALPDGRVFSFALVSETEGLGYLAAPDTAYPTELGTMTPAHHAPGCWVGGKDNFAFCAQVAE
jgi:hypothetical protein